MGLIEQYDNYCITSEPGRLLPDTQAKYHYYHYKNGEKRFDEWLKTAVKDTRSEINMNDLPRLAEKYTRSQGTVPDEPIYNLQKSLRGRLVSYCHHLLKGNADEGHLRRMTLALELISILRPQDSDDLIAECTPINFWALLQDLGSERAKADFAPFQHGGDHKAPSWYPAMPDREEKQRRMNQQSWRRCSTSSSSSSGSDSSDDKSIYSSASLASSSTSLSSMEATTWRRDSSSPPPPPPPPPAATDTAVSPPKQSTVRTLTPFSGKLMASLKSKRTRPINI